LILSLSVGLSSNLNSLDKSSIIAEAARLSLSQSPEAMLSVELQNPTNPTLLLGTNNGTLRRFSGNSNVGIYKIESLSTVIDFDGTKQTFSLSNSNNLSNNDFLKEFSKSKIAFVKTLINFKTTNNQEKGVAKPLLNKLSLESMRKADKKISNEKTTITAFTVSGAVNVLNVLKSSTDATKTSLINLDEQKKSIEAVKVKTDSIKDEALKQKVIGEEIQKLMPQDIKNQLSQQPKLEISEQQIKEVDKLVKKDISGNNFVDSNEIKSKVKLTDEQAKQVQVAMKSYNDMPTELKDGTSQAVSQVTESKTQKLLTKDQDSTAEKALSYITDFGGVKASAWTYYGYFGMQMYVEWWGWGTYLPGNTIAEIEYTLGNFGWGGMVNLVLGVLPTRCGPYVPYCYAALTVVYFQYGWITSFNRYNCGSRGITIWRAYGNAIWSNLSC
jgi:hypothetical protein